jgi:hypothetical protein
MRYLSRSVQAAARYGDPLMLAQVKMGGSVVALAQGGWDDVRAFAEPAMDLSTEVGDPRVWAATAAFLVTAAARWVAYCCAAAGLDPPAYALPPAGTARDLAPATEA